MSEIVKTPLCKGNFSLCSVWRAGLLAVRGIIQTVEKLNDSNESVQCYFPDLWHLKILTNLYNAIADKLTK